MLECNEVQSCISDYSIGLLDPKRAEVVAAHLAVCPECARELKVLEATLALVESSPQIEPPAGMWDAVYAQIAPPQTAARPSFADRLRSFFAPPVRAFAAGVAVLGVLVAMSFGRMTAPSNPVTADASTTEYVQGHAFFASQDAFADRFGLASVAGASMPGRDSHIQ